VKYRHAVLLSLLLAVPAAGHPLDPALLEITEQAGGTADVLFRVPAAQPRGASLQPVLPDTCRQRTAATVDRTAQRVSLRWSVECADGLVGQRIGVEGLGERGTDVLLRVELLDGRVFQTVLRGAEPSATVPERATASEVMARYSVLGFYHILWALDHLLFVAGLVLLVRGGRSLLWTITAFTLGHSLTLSLAVLGLVHVPPGPVEVLIAVSILVVALELTRDEEKRTWRMPVGMAFSFGLLHGLGFAGALAQAGLPEGEVPTALFSFNVGIELAQLVAVVVLLLVAELLKELPWPPRLARALPAYVIGALASYWVFERLAAL